MSLKVTYLPTGEIYYLENVSEECAKKYTYLGKKDITDETRFFLYLRNFY